MLEEPCTAVMFKGETREYSTYWEPSWIGRLTNVFGVSDIVNYSIIQLSDISCMSDVLNHLNIV